MYSNSETAHPVWRRDPVKVPVAAPVQDDNWLTLDDSNLQRYTFKVREEALCKLGFQCASFEASNVAYSRSQALGLFLMDHPKVAVADLMLPPEDNPHKDMRFQEAPNLLAPIDHQETSTFAFYLKKRRDPEDEDSDRGYFGGITVEDALGNFCLANPSMCYDDIFEHMEI